METYITDGQAGRLLDEYAMPYLKNNEFSKGLIELQNATISHITDKVENGKIGLSTETKSIFNLSLFLVFIKWLGILIVIAIIIILILKTYDEKSIDSAFACRAHVFCRRTVRRNTGQGPGVQIHYRGREPHYEHKEPVPFRNLLVLLSTFVPWVGGYQDQ